MPPAAPPSERALHTRWYPLFRLGGTAALAAAAVLHNVFVLDRSSVANLLAIVGGLAAWSLLSWSALRRWYGRAGRLDLGLAVELGDVVVCAAGNGVSTACSAHHVLSCRYSTE